MLSVLTLIFFSGGELPVDKRCEISSFLWVWSILGPESTDVIFCFHFLSSPFILHSFPLCSFHVAFMSFHFAFISFHFAFMSFHVPSLCIKDTGLRKLICSNRSGGYQPKRSRFFFICCYRCCRLAIVLEACAGCHLQVSWTCAYISSLSFCFTLIVFWAGNALAVLRCKPS